MSRSSVATMLHLTKHSFSVCPVSGIPYVISFPNLGIDFTHKSPFASLPNVEAIAKLPFATLKTLPKVTLAGIVLSYMRFTNLCETHNLKSIDCNICLQLCTTYSLVSTIKHIHEIPTRKREIMPKLAFSSMLQQVENSSAQDILKDWLQSCNDILHPTANDEVDIEELTIPSNTTIAKKPKNISGDDRKALKLHIAAVCKDPLCNVKLATVLNYISEGMTIITMDSSMRIKLIDKLALFDSLNANSIISTLRKYSDVLEDDFMDRAMDDFAIVKAKPTLSEILAARRASTSL